MMQSDLRYLLLRCRMRYIERDASFFMSMLQQLIPTILAYSSATVAVQTTGIKCVIIARDRLTLDTASLVPFINGLLPVPFPVSLNLTIVHVRYDAPPTAHLPLPRTFLLSPQHHPHPRGHLPCPSGNCLPSPTSNFFSSSLNFL